MSIYLSSIQPNIIALSGHWCEAHGCQMYIVPQTFDSICIHCQKEKRLMEKTTEMKQQIHRFKISRLQNMNFPKEFNSHNFETIDRSNENLKEPINMLSEAMERIINGIPTNLYLAGTTGTGKTCLAICLLKSLNESLSTTKKMHFVTSSDFCDEIISAKQDLSTFDTDIYRRFASIDVLVLDDFGYDDDTDARKRIIQKLLTLRYDLGKNTIITSNLPLNHGEQHMGNRCWSRFKSRLFDFPPMVQDDYRNKLDMYS